MKLTVAPVPPDSVVMSILSPLAAAMVLPTTLYAYEPTVSTCA